MIKTCAVRTSKKKNKKEEIGKKKEKEMVRRVNTTQCQRSVSFFLHCSTLHCRCKRHFFCNCFHQMFSHGRMLYDGTVLHNERKNKIV